MRARAPAAHDLLASLFTELDRLPEPHLRALMPVLVQAEAELATDLAKLLRSVPDGEVTFTAQRLRVALVQMRGSLRRLRGTSAALFNVLGAAGEQAGQMALGHMARQAEKFSALFSGTMRVLPMADAATLARGESLLLRRFKRSADAYGEWAVNEVQQQLAVGVARGETFAEMTRRLQRLNPTARNVAGMAQSPGQVADEIAAGLGKRIQNRAELIVRTEAVSAYNETALVAIGAAHAEDEDYRARWDSTLDMRGCDRCRRLHGMSRQPNKEFPGGMRCPPAHPRCRCALTYWHKDWDEPTTGVADLPAQGETGTPALAPPVVRAPATRQERLAKLADDLATDTPEGRAAAAQGMTDLLEQEFGLRRKAGAGRKGLASVHAVDDAELAYGAGKVAEGQVDALGVVKVSRVAHQHAQSGIESLIAGNATPDRLEGLHVLVHEAAHAFSPARPGMTTAGMGLVLEEVTTEVAARAISARLLATGEAVGSGAYQRYIDGVTQAIADVGGMTSKAATKALERVSMDVKRAAEALPDQSPDGFARAFSWRVFPCDASKRKALVEALAAIEPE